MSEAVLKVLLGELKVIRVRCSYCKGRSDSVIEVPVKQLEKVYREMVCPVCQQPISKGAVNPLALLARAFEAFENSKDLCEIEFVIQEQK